jgi:hypothetical protein
MEEYLNAFNRTSSQASLKHGYEQYCRNAEARHVPAYCEHDPGWHANVPDDLTMLAGCHALPTLTTRWFTGQKA